MTAQAKKYEKVNRDKREKIHLLSGILKCPVCGAAAKDEFAPGMISY